MTLRGKMVEGRWWETVRDTLPDGEVVFSTGDEYYSGCVAIVAKLDDGRWLHYGWVYGSCSGCDEWEDQPLADVKADISKGAAIMDAEHFADYLVAAKAQLATWLSDAGGSYSYSERVGLTVEQLIAAVRA